jgi:hypothetical protein
MRNMQHYAETDGLCDKSHNRIIPGALSVGLCDISTRHGYAKSAFTTTILELYFMVLHFYYNWNSSSLLGFLVAYYNSTTVLLESY